MVNYYSSKIYVITPQMLKWLIPSVCWTGYKYFQRPITQWGVGSYDDTDKSLQLVHRKQLILLTWQLVWQQVQKRDPFTSAIK